MQESDKKQAIKVELVSCEACLKKIPASQAQSKEVDDYIAYFCGLECYDNWRNQRASGESEYDVNFLIGIYNLWEPDYKQARDYFLTAVDETDPLEPHYEIYLSYLGLSEVLIDNKSGALQHTYHTSDTSLSHTPEVQLNLACAEFIKGNRQGSIQAIHKTDGLQLSSVNSEFINSFFNMIGKREQDSKGSLIRNNFIHKLMGKRFRKRKMLGAGQIETFIRDTAKKRYKNMIHSININPPQLLS